MKVQISKPEDEELAKKKSELAELETELADRELYLVSLSAELAAFEQRYLKIVGIRYARLDEIKAQMAEQAARKKTGDADAQKFARQARAQATQSHLTVEEREEKNPSSPSESQELKSLYREVAKRVHPDLSLDEGDRAVRERLMSDANRAYAAGDVTRLRHILEEYETSPDTVRGEGVGAELVRTIRKITQVKKRLTEIEKECEEMLASELAKLKAKAEQHQKMGRNLLEEMAKQVDQQIAAAQRELAAQA